MEEMLRDIKLQNYYFFSFWKERYRDNLLERSYLSESIVESPENLFNTCEGVGAIESEEFGTKKSFIGLRQPLAFLYHTGNSKHEEQLLRQEGLGKRRTPFDFASEENLRGRERQTINNYEVFISGKGFPHNLGLIGNKVVRKVWDDKRSCHLYLHPINLTLIKGASYTVYTPKVFS